MRLGQIQNPVLVQLIMTYVSCGELTYTNMTDDGLTWYNGGLTLVMAVSILLSSGWGTTSLEGRTHKIRMSILSITSAPETNQQEPRSSSTKESALYNPRVILLYQSGRKISPIERNRPGMRQGIIQATLKTISRLSLVTRIIL